ncbi:MAG: hypothetical protein EBT07_16475, partial [Actinobacteria bacterium]|nr:hypothetical protein [Actinomycetota bacterium]
KFLTSPADSQKDLRDFIHALAYTPAPRDVIGNPSQYHVMEIFGPESVDRTAADSNPEEGLHPWLRLRRDSDYDSNQAMRSFAGRNLFGAVGLVPNKELWQEMVLRSSRASEFSHPVFDSKGTVKYP